MSPTAPPALIETMRLEHGRIALWAGHRARLQASAQTLGYSLDMDAIEHQITRTIQELSAHRTSATSGMHGIEPRPTTVWRVRLLLQADGQPSIATAAVPSTPTPVRLRLATDALAAPRGQQNPQALDETNVWLRHKTTHRPWFATAQQWLMAHPEHFDLIFCNQAGLPCEGSRCNLYICDTQGRWLTPPLRYGLLPGVQRQHLLERQQVQEADISLHDLLTAPGLRVSNALRGWLDACLILGRNTAG